MLHRFNRIHSHGSIVNSGVTPSVMTQNRSFCILLLNIQDPIVPWFQHDTDTQSTQPFSNGCACMCIIERTTVNNDGSISQSTPLFLFFGNWVAPEVPSKWCQAFQLTQPYAFTQGSRGSLTPSISPCWSAIPASGSALFLYINKEPHTAWSFRVSILWAC